MKLTVKSEFRDIRNFDLIHKVGEVIDVEDSRGRFLVKLGLCECKCECDCDSEQLQEEAPKQAEGDTLFGKRGRKKVDNDDKPVS